MGPYFIAPSVCRPDRLLQRKLTATASTASGHSLLFAMSARCQFSPQLPTNHCAVLSIAKGQPRHSVRARNSFWFRNNSPFNPVSTFSCPLLKGRRLRSATVCHTNYDDYLCYTHPLEKAGDFQLQLSRMGGECISTVSDLSYAARGRFCGLLDRLHL